MATKDLEAKIVVLGSTGVGKTSLLTRFTQNTFLPPSQQPPTLGATFLTKRLVSPEHSGAQVRLQIWDTAGQERFRSLTRLYYRGANAAILCYDITDEQSFLDMQSWVEELRHNMQPGGGPGEEGGWGECIVHVVGTKADIVAEDPQRRQVQFERCVDYATEKLFSQQPPRPQPRPSSAQRTQAAPSFGAIWTGPSAIRFDDSVAAASRRRAGTVTSENPGTPTTNGGSGGGGGGGGPWTSEDASAGWDCCHEISSKDGEGVEEVFRVIVAKLVEQHGRREAGGSTACSADAASGSGGACERADDAADGGKGSFRLAGIGVVGLGERRLSWLSLSRAPSTAVGDDGSIGGHGTGSARGRGGCC